MSRISYAFFGLTAQGSGQFFFFFRIVRENNPDLDQSGMAEKIIDMPSESFLLPHVSSQTCRKAAHGAARVSVVPDWK